MTEVEFHTGVADRIGFACRLLRKASRRGVRVLVTADDATLAALDRALWTFEEREFLPHVRMPGADATVATRTPIWLANRADMAGAPRVVLNLGAEVFAPLSGADRLIEVIALEADDMQAGRARWRAYKAAGLDIRHHGAGAAAD